MPSQTRSRYFVVASLALLVLVFLGFSPTFYLRPVFGTVDDPTGSTTLPRYLILHGIALTSWYALFALQTVLVTVRRTALHRRLGWVGTVSALTVVGTGAVVLGRFAPRRIQGSVPPPPEILEGFRAIVLYQTFNLIAFAACVAAAIYFRRRIEVHRRLMLTASVLVLGAALAPARSFGAALQKVLPTLPSTLSYPVPLEATLLPLFVASLLLFDIRRHRRLLGTSVFAGIILLLIRPLWVYLALHSDLGVLFANWIGGIPT